MVPASTVVSANKKGGGELLLHIQHEKFVKMEHLLSDSNTTM